MKLLLQLRTWEFERPPWAAWIAKRNGLAAVLARLQDCPLSPSSAHLLAVLLDYPGETRDFYAQRIGVHPSTCSTYLTQLYRTLATFLNDWQIPAPAAVEPAAPPVAASPPAIQRQLPALLTPILGRSDEIRQVTRLLADPAVRLITLTGPGGIGKTSLVLACLHHLAAAGTANIVYVPLAAVADAEQVVSAIAHVLGIQGPQDAIEAQIAGQLQRPAILCLDNFEHVLPAADVIQRLLTASPALKTLVTSRSPLHLPGEQRFPVSPLGLPPRAERIDHDQLADYPAIQLFWQRLQALGCGWTWNAGTASLITQICHHVAGIPLAIELAAARGAAIDLATILTQLRQELRVLRSNSRTAPARHRSLVATLAWSYERLHAPAQELLRAIAVFEGSWNLAAAEAICSSTTLPSAAVMDALEELALDSFLLHEHGAFGLRYWLLEPIRQYALELLAASDAERYRERHARYYLHLAETLAAQTTPDEQEDGHRVLLKEHANLRAALVWLHMHADSATFLRLAAALHGFWYRAGFWVEGNRMLQAALTHPHAAVAGPALLGELWYGAGVLAACQHEPDRALQSYAQAQGYWVQTDNQRGIARAIHNRGVVLKDYGDDHAAETCFQESVRIFQAIGDQAAAALAYGNLAELQAGRSNDQAATTLLETGLQLARRSQDAWATFQLTQLSATLLQQQGRVHEAAALLDQALAMARGLDARMAYGRLLHARAEVHIAVGAAAAARSMLDESLSILRTSERSHDLGMVLFDRWRATEATRSDATALLAESRQCFEDLKAEDGLLLTMLGQAVQFTVQGQHAQARAAAEAAFTLAERLGVPDLQAWAHYALGLAAIAQGDYPAAGQLVLDGIRYHQAMHSRRGVLHGLSHVAAILGTLGLHNRQAAQRSRALQLFTTIRELKTRHAAWLGPGLDGIFDPLISDLQQAEPGAQQELDPAAPWTLTHALERADGLPDNLAHQLTSILFPQIPLLPDDQGRGPSSAQRD